MSVRSSTFVGRLAVLGAPVAALAMTAVTGEIRAAETLIGEAGTSLEEITVTARKREESLQDTPVAITAFSADQIQASNASGVDQLASFAPNVVFDTTTPLTGINSAASVVIRGIGLKDHTLTSEPGVAIYVDDVYLTHSIGNVADVVDVERVEILRGPQGTLFGRNTIGGVVRVVTKKPHGDFEAGLNTTVGSYDRLDIGGFVNLPLSESLFLRVSALDQTRDGFVATPNLPTPSLGNKDVSSVVGSLRWLASDSLTADLSINAMRDRSEGSPNVLLAVPPDATGYGHNATVPPGSPTADYWGPHHLPPNRRVDLSNDPGIETGVKVFGAALNLQWDLGDYTIKSISSYRSIDTKFGREGDHSPLRIIQTDDVMNLDSKSQELQLLGTSFEDRLDWIVGAYYFYESGFNEDLTWIGPSILLDGGGDVMTETYAVFGQGTYKLTDKWDLTLGARWTHDEKQFTIGPTQQTIIGPPGSPLVGFRFMPEGNNIATASEFDPYFNLAYHLTPDLMVYLTRAEGYKGPGFQQRNGPGAASSEKKYGPEYATMYEIGSKWRGLGGRLNLSGAVFTTDYTDLQLNVVEGVAAVTRNAGDVRINGAELELGLQAIDKLLLTAAVGYLDAEYRKLSPVAIAGGITLENELPGAPTWQASGSISYGFETALGTIKPRLDVSYSDAQFNDALNSALIERDSYTLLNASIAFEDRSGKWRATLFGTNLLDEEYIVAGYTNPAEYTEGTLSRPPEWGLKLQYFFE